MSSIVVITLTHFTLKHEPMLLPSSFEVIEQGLRQRAEVGVCAYLFREVVKDRKVQGR